MPNYLLVRISSSIVLAAKKRQAIIRTNGGQAFNECVQLWHSIWKIKSSKIENVCVTCHSHYVLISNQNCTW